MTWDKILGYNMSLSSQPEESENDTGASGGGNMVYLKYKFILDSLLLQFMMYRFQLFFVFYF